MRSTDVELAPSNCDLAPSLFELIPTATRTLARTLGTALRIRLTWNSRHLGYLSRRLSMFGVAKHFNPEPPQAGRVSWLQLDPLTRM